MAIPQQSFSFTEEASLRIELLLIEVCPIHIGTTLDGTDCAICELETRLMARPTIVTHPRLISDPEAIYRTMAELEAEAGTGTETYIRLEERLWELDR